MESRSSGKRAERHTLQMRLAEGGSLAHNSDMADHTIAVQVDRTRYTRFARPNDRERKRIELTTMEPGQRRAVVRVFLFRGEQRRLLTSFELRDLPSGEGKPLLTLTAQRVRAGRMTFQLYLDNELQAQRQVRVPCRSRILLAALLPALVVLVLAGWFFFTRVGAAIRVIGDEPSQAAAGPTEEPADAAVTKPPIDDAELEDDPPEEPEPAALEPRSTTVYFTADSAHITAEARGTLQKLYRELSAQTEAGTELTRMRLHGHTAVAGPEHGRRRLSEQRAENVLSVLQQLGLPVSRQELDELEIEGFGSTAPVTRDPDEQHRNRRVEITVE